MGYTHYWYRPKEISIEKMAAIAEDFSKIVLTLDGMGVRLADGHGVGVPQIDTEMVYFNGLQNCGHPANSEITIPWPSQTAQGVTDGKGERAGNWFCKTAYRPYDLALNAFLVIAKHHLEENILVSSDGEIQHWAEGIELCRTYLGYDELYQFSEDGYLSAVPAYTAT